MGVSLQLVCSGKLYDNRNPEYIEQIKNFIADNNLEDDIRILGFIERTEQLCLMQNAYAIVQPSLFEGWSTVVEDAKCINKFIFLSDIPVHREQNPQNVCFFDPYNEEEIIHKLLNVTPTSIPYDYSHDVRKFGESLLSVINKLKND
jgi:glycosyltransferase involved in cell wall biosynthesis